MNYGPQLFMFDKKCIDVRVQCLTRRLLDCFDSADPCRLLNLLFYLHTFYLFEPAKKEKIKKLYLCEDSYVLERAVTLI